MANNIEISATCFKILKEFVFIVRVNRWILLVKKQTINIDRFNLQKRTAWS